MWALGKVRKTIIQLSIKQAVDLKAASPRIATNIIIRSEQTPEICAGPSKVSGALAITTQFVESLEIHQTLSWNVLLIESTD